MGKTLGSVTNGEKMGVCQMGKHGSMTDEKKWEFDKGENVGV